MSAHIARKVVQSFQRPAPTGPNPTEDLSPREKEVLDLLSQGLIYKEIADKLGISYETVHTYVRRIYEKLQVHSKSEAVAKAHLGGLKVDTRARENGLDRQIVESVSGNRSARRCDIDLSLCGVRQTG